MPVHILYRFYQFLSDKVKVKYESIILISCQQTKPHENTKKICKTVGGLYQLQRMTLLVMYDVFQETWWYSQCSSKCKCIWVDMFIMPVHILYRFYQFLSDKVKVKYVSIILISCQQTKLHENTKKICKTVGGLYQLQRMTLLVMYDVCQRHSKHL